MRPFMLKVLISKTTGKSVRRYLKSMECASCKGAGCKACLGTGNSARFERLLFAATTGMHRP